MARLSLYKSGLGDPLELRQADGNQENVWGDAMSMTALALLAYLLAGLSRVALDFLRSADERPAYTRRRSFHLVGSTVMILCWLPFAIVLALQSRRWHGIEPLVTTTVVFALLLAAGRHIIPAG